MKKAQNEKARDLGLLPMMDHKIDNVLLRYPKLKYPSRVNRKVLKAEHTSHSGKEARSYRVALLPCNHCPTALRNKHRHRENS